MMKTIAFTAAAACMLLPGDARAQSFPGRAPASTVFAGPASGAEAIPTFKSAVVVSSFAVGTSTNPGAGLINVLTGFRIGNAAASGNYLRGNGTNFVSGTIQAGDLPGGANSITIAIGANVGISTSGCAPVALGGTCTLGATTDTWRAAALGLGMTAPATGVNIGNAIVNVASNGQAALGASATAGAQWQGQGSSTDIVIQNKTPATVCSVATGTTTFNCIVLQSATVAGGTAASSTLTLESTSGAGTTDSIVFKTASQTTRMTITTAGNIGFAKETNPQYPVVASGNTTTGLTTSQSGTALLVVAADASSSTMAVDTYGGAGPTSNYAATVVGGTAASQSDTPAGSGVQLILFGRANGTILTTAPGKIAIAAINAWSATDTSTQISFFTTPSGSTTRAEAVRINGSTGLSIGGALTDPGAGGLFVNGATITLNGLATDATHTDRTVCQDTTSKSLFFGSGAAGICLGTSSLRYKNVIGPVDDGLSELMKLHAVRFFYRPGYGDDGVHLMYGFTAENVAAAVPGLARSDTGGKAYAYDYVGLEAVMIRAIQQLKADNDNLRARIEHLERRIAR